MTNPHAEQNITRAAKLYEIRAAMRLQLGSRFGDVMRENVDWLRRISAVSGESVLEVAIRAATELKAKYQTDAAAIILAAAVEDAEPTTEGVK